MSDPECGDWQDIVADFEERLSEYCCSKDHSAAPEPCESELWDVELHFNNYDGNEDYVKVRLCSSHEIAVEEAVHLLWDDSKGAFYETDCIFDDAVADVAAQNNATQKLEQMRQTLRNIVQCRSCYEALSGEWFDKPVGREKVFVKPALNVITKKRKLGERNGGNKK